MATPFNFDHIIALLEHPYEVNQELGIATLSAAGLPDSDNYRKKLKLRMANSLLKLQWCIEYQLTEVVEVIALQELRYDERSKLNILEKFPNLKELSLPKNSYINYEWIIDWSKFQGLQKLSLRGNRLNSFPKGLQGLSNIRSLDLGKNRLLKLSAFCNSFPKLEQLNLSHNKLKKLPLQLGGLKTLKLLYVNHNYLTNLELDLKSLTKLEVLKLTANRFREIPAVIMELKALKELDLSANLLTDIPEELFELPVLERVKIQGNPIPKHQKEALKAAWPKLDITI